MNVNAIETAYNGYRFRSRLEARWAVFFDEAGIEYQYEPEGFEYNGERYLPDFFLPEHDLYIEVKPSDYSRIGELKKAVEVCCRATGKMLVIFSEIPDIVNSGIWIYNAFYYHPANRECMYRPVILEFFEKENGTAFISNYSVTCVAQRYAECYFGELKRIYDRTGSYTLKGWSCVDFEQQTKCVEARDPDEEPERFRCCYYDTEIDEGFNLAKAAYEKAKQARFEYEK